MRCELLAGLALLPCAALAGQLPMVSVPHQSLRFEVGGSFRPVDDLWRDGKKVGVGSLLSGTLDATTSPLVGDLERNLAAALGRDATSGSMGSLTTVAQWQHNVGTLSAAWGATAKLTLFTTVPIVSVRTERQTTYNADNTTLGLNPANLSFGTVEGRNQANAYLTGLDNAITELGVRIESGTYAGPTLTLAQQTLVDAGAFRSTMQALFSASGSPLLPLANTPDADALQQRIAALNNTFSNDLGITGLAGTPTFPGSALDAGGFAALLASTGGFDIRPRTGQPLTILGRIEIGANLELARRSTESDTAEMRTWGRALVRLGTGNEPNNYALLDQGTGGRAHEIEFGGTIDLHRPRKGLRGDLAVTLPLASSGEQRLGTLDEILLPTSRIVFASHRVGMGLAATAQPWTVLTPHLMLAGLARVTWRADDHYSIPAGHAALPSAADLGKGRGGSALQVGVGLNYLHDGHHQSGLLKRPVEAGFSVERTVTSFSGTVPAEMTFKLFLRFYRAVGQH